MKNIVALIFLLVALWIVASGCAGSVPIRTNPDMLYRAEETHDGHLCHQLYRKVEGEFVKHACICDGVSVKTCSEVVNN